MKTKKPTEKKSPFLVRMTTERRMRILSVICILLLLAVVARIFSLQVFGYRYYQKKVIDQITAGSLLKAPRGKIYDRNGVCLAESKTVYRIYLSPVDIAYRGRKEKKDYGDIIASGLAPILSLSYDTLYEKTKKAGRMDETIYKNASDELKNEVLSFVEREGLTDMVHIEAGEARYYPFGSFASHVIGFTGSDSQGLFGLEAYYNELLTGTDGQYITARDATSKVLENGYAGYIPPVEGQSIVTTLDVYLQRELELCLAAALLNTGADNRVTGAVMNVHNGEIYAMATLPSYDLNDPYTLDEASAKKLSESAHAEGSAEYRALKSELLYEMWNNKAVSEIYEPGSTFKIVTTAMALDSGTATPKDHFVCTGSYKVGGYNISCHKRGGHGALSFTEGLQHSCNPVMMQLAERIGSERFYEYYAAFGYLEKTGIDLPSEASGIFHKEDAIGSTELATASFGQRFKVSPIQQLRAVATVANGGISVTPHLLRYATDASGKVTETYKEKDGTQVVSREVCETLWQILEGGVSGGAGAKNAYVAGYEIAAKTGTSEKFDVLDANGNSYLRIGSCVAFAPASAPELALIIIVDEPMSQNKYGSVTAAPYVGAFLEGALPYLGYEPSYNESEKTVTVGGYTGLSVTDAKKELAGLGLSVTVLGNGSEVLSQVPSFGSRLYTESGRVILYTEPSVSESEKEAVVPKVIGKTAAEANELLLNQGLNIAFKGAEAKNGGLSATVVSQSLPEGLSVPKGSIVEVYLLHTDESD